MLLICPKTNSLVRALALCPIRRQHPDRSALDVQRDCRAFTGLHGLCCHRRLRLTHVVSYVSRIEHLCGLSVPASSTAVRNTSTQHVSSACRPHKFSHQVRAHEHAFVFSCACPCTCIGRALITST